MEKMSDNLFSTGILHLYWIIDAIAFWKEVLMLKSHISRASPHILKQIKQLFPTRGLNALNEISVKQFKFY